ncbi:protein of unknown function [Nocardia cyriacigeorgica GUH-2]|uniref:Uncharacterized protein n=1 Tax=Nocardia cyriacigeorgica (strain GUH-2) TaxID=1127134 RepID=H6R978_NOCCG|nr:protein of unknown function [Nocardia cyriacigeorgica GUH-2]
MAAAMRALTSTIGYALVSLVVAMECSD